LRRLLRVGIAQDARRANGRDAIRALALGASGVGREEAHKQQKNQQ
jgi:hypothetical protein